MQLNDQYFLNPAHLELARARYFLKNENGQPEEEDIDEVFCRTVNHIYKNDPENKEEALELRREKKIIDAGRPLAQAGTKTKNLLNCFVIGFEDDTREAISELKRKHFNIQALGGGTGINFSILRPHGSVCKSTQSRSSGATGFITDFSYQSSNISQGGNRSGANMGILEDWHPDLFEFITKKSKSNWENIRKFATVHNEDGFSYFQWLQPYQWQMFNVSVFVSDKLMQSVVNGGKDPWVLSWNDEPWHLWDFEMPVGPATGEKYMHKITVVAANEDMAWYKASAEIPYFNNNDLKLVKDPYDITTGEWFSMICKNAWEDGCPGIVFVDSARRYHNAEYFNPIEATNPCAEQMLPRNSVCCLASLILPTFFVDGEFLWDEFERAIRQAVRGLDNIISINKTGERDIDENSLNERRIGLGTTGVAELLIIMKLKYSSQKGRNFVAKILEFLRDKAYEASIELAKELGSFPAYEYKGFSQSEFFKTLPENIQNLIRRHGIRNVTILTQAPVGCQSPDTLVLTDSGILELGEMIDINGSQWQNHNYNITQDIGSNRKSTKGFVNGVHKTKKINMYSGLDLESTYNHKYRVLDLLEQEYMWKRADDLKVGDLLAVKIGGYTNTKNTVLDNNINFHFNTNHICLPDRMSVPFARFLGVYFADGSNHKKGIRIAFNSKDKNRIKYYETLISNIFGLNELYKENNKRGCTSIYINSRPLLEFLYKNKLNKQKSHKVEIPMAVRSSSYKVLSAFIEGYYDGDGSETSYNRYIDTVSEKMAKQLAICQRALGVNVRIEKHDNVKGSFGNRTKYRIKTIGFGSLDFDTNKNRYVGKNRRRCARLARAIDKSIFFDEIVSIENSKSLTLDIEVPKTHTYISNSIVSHNTTGTMVGFATGCEPYFAMCFLRNSRVGSFQDGSPAFIAWLSENKINYEDHNWNLNVLREKIDVPEWFEEAHEISWMDHLKMQAVFAKFNDSSISKTINLPNEATVKDVEEAYISAYKMGIKSTTVYRDGSKQQILEHIVKESNKVRPAEIIRAHAPKRPRELECDIHHTSVKGDKWTILVGIMDDRPYEIFCAPQESFEISSKYKKGIIVKNGRGSYHFDTGDFKLKNISCYLKTDEHRVITRLISTCLRHGVPMPFISDQLAKVDGTVVDFSKAILRVLKKYGDINASLDKSLSCTSCGSSNVVLNSGCPECLDCGVSKCG